MKRVLLILVVLVAGVAAWLLLQPAPAPAPATNGWGAAAAQPAGPLDAFKWMAWTWPTAAFFVFVFFSISLMGFLEWLRPGGAPRLGALGLETTRGDRLFITLLGAAFLFLGWLGVMGTPLWGGLALSLLWGTFVFARV